MPKLTRRQALRSAAATLWLPVLPSVLPRAARAAPPSELEPKRLLIYFLANGMIVGHGNNAEAEPDPYNVLGNLDPLAARRTIVTGMNNRTVGSFSDHEPCTPALLSDVAPRNYFGGPFDVGVTADQVAARQIGDATPFPSLQLGVATQFEPISPHGRTYSARISWSSPETPLPPTEVPRQLFDSMFSGYDPEASAEEIERRSELRRSVLDSVLDHINPLERKLNPTDRAKLDQYTTSIRELEQRLVELEEKQCPTPDAPGNDLDFENTIAAFVDLMIVALQCDYTRVLTFMSSPSSSYQVYRWLGQSTNHHVLSHAWSSSNSSRDQLIAIQQWHTAIVNGMCERLAEIQLDDDTDLLSHTLVCYLSEFSDPWDHDSHPVPFVLIGGEAGGVLQGRHLHVPGGESHANMLRAFDRVHGRRPVEFRPQRHRHPRPVGLGGVPSDRRPGGGTMRNDTERHEAGRILYRRIRPFCAYRRGEFADRSGSEQRACARSWCFVRGRLARAMRSGCERRGRLPMIGAAAGSARDHVAFGGPERDERANDGGRRTKTMR